MSDYAQVSPDIRICYERLGDPSAPPIVLIMGLAAQLIAWPDGFCDALVARGFQIVRFDNRDAGLSSAATAPYTLSDMAADTVGLMDALGWTQAHLVGASLGGMIAQTIAIEHPDRVLSLVSMMSTTGAPDVGQPQPEVTRAFASGPPPTTREQIIAKSVEMFTIIGSPGFPTPPEEVAARTGRGFNRAFNPAGIGRQAMAVGASGDRTARLRDVRIPTLVIHGANDKIIDASGGRATAAAIPGASLEIIDGMGHDLAKQLWPRFVDAITDRCRERPRS